MVLTSLSWSLKRLKHWNESKLRKHFRTIQIRLKSKSALEINWNELKQKGKMKEKIKPIERITVRL